jgi:hypothetical protein
MQVAEVLSRDQLAPRFQMTDDLAFPLTLELTSISVVRDAEGPPSVFLTLYSPTGGTPERTWVDGLESWIFVPILIMCFCSAQALSAHLATEPGWDDDDRSA